MYRTFLKVIAIVVNLNFFKIIFCRYANKSDVTKAIQDFEKALSIDPKHNNAKKYLFEVIMDRAIWYILRLDFFFFFREITLDLVKFNRKLWKLRGIRWLFVLLPKTHWLQWFAENESRLDSIENKRNQRKSNHLLTENKFHVELLLALIIYFLKNSEKSDKQQILLWASFTWN